MKISYQWLKEFVDVPVDARTLAQDLAMVGLPVESIEAHGDDSVLEIEVTANRGDCLSHWGIAREVATIYRLPLKPITIAFPEEGSEAAQAASVQIADADLCYRYCARVVSGVKVGPSPAWLVKKLESVGQRSINNIADITNLVLFELGHPLHAFDLDKLSRHSVIVRRAKKGERLTTLDGVERTLDRDNLVIADAQKPVALAGVMGGGDSEISPSTKNVLIESAWFLPTSIRQTARSMGLHTEASHRFERGADLNNAVTAMNRCAQLIRELAGGSIHRGFIDCYPQPVTPPEILLRHAQLRRHLGVDIDAAQMERILESLQFEKTATEKDGQRWRVPSWRNDVTREIDLVEEIARHYGYEKFPARLPKGATRGTNLPWAKPVAQIRERLRALGYFEAVAFPFLDAEEGAKFSHLTPVEMANPLSEVAAAMRTTALPSLLDLLGRNIRRGQRDVRLFEVGKIYYRDNAKRVRERPVLVFGATGDFRAKNVHEAAAKAYDFFALKGDVDEVLSLFETGGAACTPAENPFNSYRADQSCDVSLEGKRPATFGALNPAVLERYKIKQDVFAAEIDLEWLLSRGLRQFHFRGLSPFPAVERDLSFVLSTQISCEEILRAVKEVRAEHLTDVHPFDRYQHASLGEGQYSFSLRLTFQSNERTLVEQEVNPQVERVMQAIESRLGARIRKEM